MKTLKHWQKKLKNLADGNSYAHGLIAYWDIKNDSQIHQVPQNYSGFLHSNQKGGSSKTHMETEMKTNNKTTIRKKRQLFFNRKNNTGSITVFDLKLYYRPNVNNTALYWFKNRHVD